MQQILHGTESFSHKYVNESTACQASSLSTLPGYVEKNSRVEDTNANKRHIENSRVDDTLSSLYKSFVDGNEDVYVDRINPDFVKLRQERVRLATFHDWPPTSHFDPRDMALNGFFFKGSSDRVQCAFCEGCLQNWTSDDVIEREHRTHFPDCRFVRGVAVENIANGLTRSNKPTRYDSLANGSPANRVVRLIRIVS